MKNFSIFEVHWKIRFLGKGVLKNQYRGGDYQGTLYIFFYCYLAVPQPTLGHSQGDSLTNPMLITTSVLIRPEGHWEPRNEVGSLSPAERLAGFEPGTFRFLLLKPLGHSPQKLSLFSREFRTFSTYGMHLYKSYISQPWEPVTCF